MGFVAETVGRRAAGDRPSRTRAVIVSGVAGVAVAVLVYKLLRTPSDVEQQ